jgi:two-component system, chemotaxis family, chemotaxis protein CheY
LARKILLADDSVTAQNMGRKILADAGYEVITVNNGSAALKKIAEAKPDLIVLDVYMPGYSGLEVCQRLKEVGETARIPVLLTVGKLEPFKPEEAKRVRAEGFIVKPFEASELLSALTKLEDKMVPRSESSKPGRFARAIAAVEEGRYDKTVAADEDSGWKNRIAFPSKKKGKTAEPEDGDDPAIYNPVNKDLRTVVEHKPTPVPYEAKPHSAMAQDAKAHDAKAHVTKEDSRIDLGALAPDGLPKDVTPEEIAALAAAAAQIQGKVAEPHSTELAPSEPIREQPRAHEGSASDKIESDKLELEKIHASDKIENRAEPRPDAQPTVIEAAPAVSASEPVAATFAEPEPEDKPAPQEKPGEGVSNAASADAPTHAEVTETTAALETAASPAASSSDSSQGRTYDTAHRSEAERFEAERCQAEPAGAEPVTMASATGAELVASPSRWTAVAVAVAPEEAATALEEEMRKACAYGAFVGGETAPAEAIASLPDTKLGEELATPVNVPVAMEAAPVETVQQVASPLPAEAEVAPTINAVTSTTAEEINSRVKEFETVAASSIEAPVPTELGPTPVQFSESATPASEPHPQSDTTSIEAKAEEAPIAPVAEPAATVATEVAPATQPEAQNYEESAPAREELHCERLESAATAPAATVEEVPAISAEKSETANAISAIETAVEQSSAAEYEESVEPEPSVRRDGSKESEMAATTAAAWASWRRIRESSDPHDAAQPTNNDEYQAPSSRDEAAMAVAAGAEKAPEEAPEIASIVDSVLADLRPKIVEEISKKLKKKK